MEDRIFIDVEASGFGQGSYPIEIGIAGPADDLVCFLVRPPAGWDHWDAKAEMLHGIARDTLFSYGREVDEVAKALNGRLAGQTAYTDAWGQDMPWLAKLFDVAGIVQRFRVESVVSLLSEAEQARWHPLKGAITDRLRLTRHRASTDARILKLTYEALTRPVEAGRSSLPAFSAARSGSF